MTTTSDNIALPTDVPGAFAPNTIYLYHYELDSVLFNCQRLIDFRVRQAEERLDAMLRAAEKRERWEWVRWLLHQKTMPIYRSWEQQDALYRQWIGSGHGAVAGTSIHRDPPTFLPRDLGSEDWHYDSPRD